MTKISDSLELAAPKQTQGLLDKFKPNWRAARAGLVCGRGAQVVWGLFVCLFGVGVWRAPKSCRANSLAREELGESLGNEIKSAQVAPLEWLGAVKGPEGEIRAS